MSSQENIRTVPVAAPPTGVAPSIANQIAGPAVAPGVQPSALMGESKITFSNPPTNVELLRTADHLQTLLASQENLTVGEAKRVLLDAERVLRSGKALLLEKNADEKVQSLIIESRAAARELAQPGSAIRSSLADQQLVEKAQRKLHSSRDLVLLLVRSTQFRDAAMELFTLFSEALGWRSKPSGAAQEQQIRQQLAEMPPTTVPVTVTTTTTTKAATPTEPNVTTVTVPVSLPPLTAEQLRTLTGPALRSRKEQVRAQIRTIMQTLSTHEAYRRGVKNLLRTVDQVSQLLSQASTQRSATAATVATNVHVQIAMEQAKRLLQAFCGGTDTAPFFTNVTTLVRQVRDDPQLRQYVEEVRDYLLAGIQSPQEVFADDARLKRLLRHGRRLFRGERYRQPIATAMSESAKLLRAMANDTTTKQFVQDLGQLGRDLLLNADGQPTLKLELLRSMKDLLGNLLIEELRWVQLPAVTATRGEMSFTIDNVSLHALSIVPEKIVLKNKTKTKLHPRTMGTSAPAHGATKGHLKVKIRDITGQFDNVHYSIRRGSFLDTGTANLRIGDRHGLRGMDISIILRTSIGPNVERFFVLEAVKVHTDKLKWSLHSNEHRVFMKLIKPFVNLRRRIDIAVEESVIRATRSLESRLVAWSHYSVLPDNLQRFAPVTARRVSTAHGTMKDEKLARIMQPTATVTTGPTAAVPASTYHQHTASQ